MSLTDGVYGKCAFPCHCSRQSSSERNEARGAAGLLSMAFQAFSLTDMSDIPGGPPRHFCGPATQTSSCQESASKAMPPTDDTQSTSVSTPCRRAMGPISEQSLKVPDGVSECTTVSSSVSGCSVRYSSTACGSTA